MYRATVTAIVFRLYSCPVAFQRIDKLIINFEFGLNLFDLLYSFQVGNGLVRNSVKLLDRPCYKLN